MSKENSDIFKQNGLILHKIQQALKVTKDRHNEFGGYNYRSADDILIALKPLLVPYGWSVRSTDRVETRGNHNYQVSEACLYDHECKIVIHSEAWAREDEDRKKMDAPQLSGSAASYATKRAWGNLLGIDDTKDSDATNVHEGTVIPAQGAFSYSIGTYADKSKHPMLLNAFKKMEKRQDKISSLEDMMQHLDEAIPLPDYTKAALKSLDSYCQLFLSTLHNQEANKLMKESIKNGVSVDEALKVFESKGVEPRVVNQINLKQKEEKVDPKTGYVQPNLDYI